MVESKLKESVLNWESFAVSGEAVGALEREIESMPYICEGVTTFDPADRCQFLIHPTKKNITAIMRLMFGASLPLYEHEKAVLRDFHKYLRQKGLQLPPGYDDRYILRWAQYNAKKPEETMKQILANHEWRLARSLSP